ncbi:MAG: 4Fe-4S binding protein [Crocinitomicaceae bacterium]|nr:4Fe-4S binding protein [Crocinitomicaceae bacterium]
MAEQELNFSVSGKYAQYLNLWQKLGMILALSGTGIILITWGGVSLTNNAAWLTVVILSIFIGTVMFTYGTYAGKTAGIKNDGVYFRSHTARGAIGWAVGIVLTAFYVFLYWFPSYLGYQTGVNGTNEGLIALFDPLSYFFKGKPASQWFVYGSIYTLVIVSLGIKFIVKYRHNRYHIIRTISVMIAQLGLAYLVPEILAGMNYNDVSQGGEYLGWYDADLKNVWPLDYDFFYGWHLDAMQQKAYQPIGMIYLVWGILLFLIVTPIITYFVGKRWYCSWVCGCGGLAETAGDPYRHLSSKKLSAWKLERWLIHAVLVLVFLMTAVTLYGYFFNTGTFFGLEIYTYFQKPYGFVIGAIFSGIVGVGFYPLLGNRVWCRFGCPMAAYMGIIQRFKSRFRITTNGGQCISCGNCSTYCEQGIDVRAYAQKGQNIVRASCVGCGVCSAVCPRGVLKLENGPEEKRLGNEGPIVLGNDGFKIEK